MSLAFPRLAAAGFWAWARRHRADRHLPGQQRRSRRRQRGHGRPVPRRPRAGHHRPGRRRRLGRRHRAHDAGSGHAHEPGPVLLVVGAGGVDRPAAHVAGRARRAHLRLRRPPLRPGPVRRQHRRRLAGSASPSPSRPPTSSPCPAVGIAAELVPGHVPHPDAGARRASTPASAWSASPPSRRSPSRPASTCRGRAAGVDLDGFGDKLSDLLPYALFTLLPLLGVLIVMALGAHGRHAGAGPGPPAHHGRLRVRLLRRSG